MKKILCLTDFSANSLNAIKYANILAKNFSSTLIFMHTYKLHVNDEEKKNLRPSLTYYSDTESRNKLSELCMNFTKEDRYTKVNYEFLVKEGKVTQHLNEIIVNNNIDLLVLSAEGEPRPEDAYYGNILEEILQSLKCPVIVVPIRFQSHKNIENIIYAYDIENEKSLEKEAVDFAKLFNAKLEILSFVTRENEDHIEKLYSKYNHIKSNCGYDKLNFTIQTSSDIKETMEEFIAGKPFDLITLENHQTNTHKQLNDPGFIQNFVFVSKIPVLIIYSE
jgi:nucleotide-binding universal stress UspA family protein